MRARHLNEEVKGGGETQRTAIGGNDNSQIAAVLPTPTAFNPHMMPLMKFSGENWEDFIEHFERFADACGMRVLRTNYNIC